jgi:hypothetical protein
MVDIAQLTIVSAFMFVAGVISMKGLLFPSSLDPTPEIVLSAIVGAITGGFALVFLNTLMKPSVSNVYGTVGIMWLLGVGIVVLFKLGERYA